MSMWLKPRVILATTLLSLLITGGYYGLHYCKRYPVSLWYIQWVNSRSLVSGKNLQGPRIYPNSIQVINQVESRPIGNGLPGTSSDNYSALKQSWKTKLPKGIFGAVTLSGNSVFVGCDDGNTYELNQGNGEILRRFYTGTEVM